MTSQRSSIARVTQADVARLSGVSQTVVSMVLNGTGMTERRVSDETRQRVLKAIAQTGYAANPMAQRLAGGRTSIVGVYTYESVFPRAEGDFYRPFMEGIEEAAEAAGVDLILFTSMVPRRDSHLLATGGINRLRVSDGAVLLGRRSHPQDLAALLSQDFPFAFVGRRGSPTTGVPYAGAAYDDATETVVERLLAQGHTRIALVHEYTDHESVEDRVGGYRRAMRAAGLPAMTLSASEAIGTDFIDSLQSHRVTATVVTADVADPLYSAAAERGLRLPSDLSIARLGDPEHTPRSELAWSGFTIPRREMGVGALNIVLRRISGEDGPIQLKIPCAIVDGETITAPKEDL